MGFPLRRKKTIAFLHNPHSGKNTPRSGYGKILADIIATPRYTYDTSTLGELKLATREIHGLRPEIVGVCGGDGTLGLDITRLLREWSKTPGMPLPQLLYFPTGTRCVVGENLGLMSHSAEDLAKRIRYKIENNLPFDTAYLNPLKINDQYGFMYGTGLPAAAVKHYYDKASYLCVDAHREYGLEGMVKREKPPCKFRCRWDKAGRFGTFDETGNFVGRCPKCGQPLERELGNKRFAQVVFETIWDEVKAKLLFRESQRIVTKPVYAEIELPSGYDPPYAPFMEYTGIMCSTVESMGNGCRGMPRAREKPDHFMLRSINLGFWGVARVLPFLWSGQSLMSNLAFDAVVRSLTIKYKTPTLRTIDGDLSTSQLDRIEVGPLLTFIVG